MMKGGPQKAIDFFAFDLFKARPPSNDLKAHMHRAARTFQSHALRLISALPSRLDFKRDLVY